MLFFLLYKLIIFEKSMDKSIFSTANTNKYLL